ncbi:conserved protein, DUF1456 family [Escherichia coli]|uniref:Conserved protein, DUF1456 family n=44 Tax=Bacteria TaxID=2 RepID=A0A377BQS2_ECOLX|nr:conserved protein, DUF1456 family [Escherichia coli]
MLSNDILRSVRYILKANNNDLVRILALGNVEATAEQIAVWLRKEDEEGFQRCPDIVLSSFLNGLIYEKRGKDESAPALEPERRINNNIVLKKLRIAFSLKTDDILAILTEQQFRVSMPEITAMMRAPDHKNFRECGDQFFTLFSAWTGSAPACEKRLKNWRSCLEHDRQPIISLFKTSGFHHQFHLRHSDTFLASSAETLIPEIPCRALKSTFSISIVTFSCA